MIKPFYFNIKIWVNAMKRLFVFLIIAFVFLSMSEKLSAQNIYELRKFTEDASIFSVRYWTGRGGTL